MKKVLIASLIATGLSTLTFAADKDPKAVEGKTDTKAVDTKKSDAKAMDSKTEAKDKKGTPVKLDASKDAAGAKDPEGITGKCAIEFAVNGKSIGTVIVGVFGNTVPKTAANFMELCGGDKDKKTVAKYPGSTVHRVIPGFMIQAGDFENNNGTGGSSIYGAKFPDENFKLKHTGSGILSMANAGPNTNGSQFFITVAATPWLDGHHVVFGKVVEDKDGVIKKVEALGSQSGSTNGKITIASSKLAN